MSQNKAIKQDEIRKAQSKPKCMNVFMYEMVTGYSNCSTAQHNFRCFAAYNFCNCAIDLP